jgi:hypothetical protein
MHTDYKMARVGLLNGHVALFLLIDPEGPG